MRVVLAGSHGLLGTALTGLLSQRGWSVQRLVRRPARSTREIPWDPAAGYLNPADLAGVDAVVNLGGASLGAPAVDRGVPADHPRRRGRVRRAAGPDARDHARPAAGSCCRHRPSATTATGATEVLSEASPRGAGFLADVVAQWEAATAPAEQAGVRVVHLRTGSVALARTGNGSSRLIVAATRLGLGGPLGPGTNYWSWITTADHAAAALHLLDADVRGPVNLTAPNPVTQREVIATLARALHRPALVRVPARLLRAMLHDVADELLLSSQRALPTVLESTGFTWQHPTIADAAAWLTARD